jgi:hypothetical protein
MPDEPAIAGAVQAAWVGAFGQPAWDANARLADVTGDSLDILGVLFEIEQALGIDVPDNVVSAETTPRALLVAVAGLASAPATVVHDDRPLVFLFAGGLTAAGMHAVQDGLEDRFRLVPINGPAADEQMLHYRPGGAINVIADAGAAAAASDAVASLAGRGYRRGFTFLVDADPRDHMPAMRARIIDAFVASQRGG